MKSRPIDTLKERLVEIAHLSSAGAVLGWDQEVYMPEKGVEARAAASAAISGIAHEKIVNLDADGVLTRLQKQVQAKKLRGKNGAIVRETLRSYERLRKLPEAFVRELTETAAKSHHAWVLSRTNNDFKTFLPWLTKIVELKRRQAAYIGYKDSPYDALLEGYEPGMTTKEASVILADLKDFLVPFLKKVRRAQPKVDTKLLRGDFPIDKQLTFDTHIATRMGFDLHAGRIDRSVHPFTTTFHPCDVRITTRYREHDLLYSIGSTIHETGHALYEQGLPSEQFGTPLAEAVSFGIHESQSRLWENNIGKSRAFWKYFYPRLQAQFPKPFKNIPLRTFLEILNHVRPSLIRTEADEVTYNLHIIVRFEIEKEMIEGTIDLRDLPAIWNAKMKEYLGVTVPNDALGVLQDTHWSQGEIGYFPTYALGNLYAAQLYNTMRRDIPTLSRAIAKGRLAVPREWLRNKVHQHGKLYTAADLLKRVTGEYPTSAYFIAYLKEKYQAYP